MKERVLGVILFYLLVATPLCFASVNTVKADGVEEAWEYALKVTDLWAYVIWKIGNWLQDLFWGSTAYAPGVTLDSYMETIAHEFQHDIEVLAQIARDKANLLNGTYYYFARKAEYAAQYYINYSTWDDCEELVALKSGIYREFYNISSSILDSYASLVSDLHNFAANTLTGDLADCNVEATRFLIKIDGINGFIHGPVTASSLKSYSFKPLHMVRVYKSSSPSLTATFKVYGKGLLVFIWGNNYGDSNPVTIKAYVYDYKGNLVYNYSESVDKYQFITWKHLEINDTGLYTVELKVIPSRSSHLGLALATDMLILETSTTGSIVDEYLTLLEASHLDCEATADYSSAAWWSFSSKKFKFSSSNTSFGVAWSALEDNYLSLVTSLRSIRTSALSLAYSHWQTLKNLGYNSYEEIPPDSVLVLPDVMIPPNEVLQNMTRDEAYAMWVAYLLALNKTFTDGAYKNVDRLKATQVNFTNAKILVNATIYLYNSTSGAYSKLVDKHLFVFLPQNDDLDLVKGQNTTLSQFVTAIDTNAMKVYTLKPNDKIYAWAIYREGEEVNSTTIAKLTVYQYVIQFYLPSEPPETTGGSGSDSSISSDTWKLIALGLGALLVIMMLGGAGGGVVVVRGRRGIAPLLAVILIGLAAFGGILGWEAFQSQLQGWWEEYKYLLVVGGAVFLGLIIAAFRRSGPEVVVVER